LEAMDIAFWVPCVLFQLFQTFSLNLKI